MDTKSLDLSNMYHDSRELHTRRVLGSRRVWVEKVFLCLCVCVDLKENGVRGSMYSREFVSSVLELVKANCPEVCLSLSTRQLMRV